MGGVDGGAVGAGVASVFGGGKGMMPEKDAKYGPQDMAHDDDRDDDRI